MTITKMMVDLMTLCKEQLKELLQVLKEAEVEKFECELFKVCFSKGVNNIPVASKPSSEGTLNDKNLPSHSHKPIDVDEALFGAIVEE